MTGKSLDDLEFAKVQTMISSFRLSEEGGEFLASLPFAMEKEELTLRQGYISRILGSFERDGVPALAHFPSIADVMDRLGEPTPSLDGPGLLDLARYLQSSEELFDYLLRDEEEALRELIGPGIDPALIALKEAILADLDESGSVRENHPRLQPLYRQLEQVRQKRASYCSSFIRDNRSSVQSDVEALRDAAGDSDQRRLQAQRQRVYLLRFIKRPDGVHGAVHPCRPEQLRPLGEQPDSG
ncbi:MAG TPA: hypothetical protein PKN79_02720 [Sphaerochaeta sp.]|nr:hypothetical protein [Sphaerochaeta sp.]